MFGLHPNAEIGYLTNLGETIFNTILKISGSSAGSGAGGDSAVKDLIEKFLKDCPEPYNMVELMAKAPELTPYIIVSIQEVERMNLLLSTIRHSLNELNQGLAGSLNITDAMEVLK
jgi:dynein heavy chain